jgi:hypothetical protein
MERLAEAFQGVAANEAKRAGLHSLGTDLFVLGVALTYLWTTFGWEWAVILFMLSWVGNVGGRLLARRAWGPEP